MSLAAPVGERPVLVVDDNPAGRLITGRALEKAGFRVRQAGSGREALQLAREAPAVVVLDVNLPDMDGFEVCRRLRARPETAAVPVIMLSAERPDSASQVAGLDSGADGYLTQPVDKEVLVATVRAMLRIHHAEAAARASEHRLQAVLDAEPECVKLVAADGTLLDMNPAGLAMVEASGRDDVIGKPVCEIVSPEHRAAFRAFIERTCAGERGAMEFEIVSLRGTRRWMESHAVPLRLAEHDTPVALAVTRDVSERKRAETLLAGEKRLLELIIGGTALPAVLEALCCLVEELAHGVRCAILLRDDAEQRTRVAAAPSFPDDFRQVIAGLPLGEGEGPCIGPGCSAVCVVVADLAADARWTEWADATCALGLRACTSTPIVTPAGAVLGMFALFYGEPRGPSHAEQQLIDRATNLASVAIERRRTEQSVRRQAERLTLLHRLDQAILAADSAQGIAEHALSYLRQLLPTQRTSVILLDGATRQVTLLALDSNRPTRWKVGVAAPFEALGPNMLAALERGDIYAIADCAAESEEPAASLTREGLRSFMSLPLRARGELIGAFNLVAEPPHAFSAEHVAIAREVADELAIAIHQAGLHEEVRQYATEMERRVVERTQQLETAVDELESFSYSVSHDLRAPLRAIDGFAAALAEDFEAQLDDQGRDFLARIRAASVRMDRLINDLLDLARVTRAEIVRQPVDLSALAQSVADELQRAEPARRVGVTIAPGLAAEADPQLMRVVFENLLGNAWKYTSTKPEAHIEVGATEQAGVPIFFVRDDGVGFEDAYADKLFQPFQRLHTERHFAGTGIGLATVRRIVVRHGGAVWATGAPMQGATFSFTLEPVAAHPAEPHPAGLD